MKNLRQKHHMDGLTALLLFGVLAVCILSVLLLGADAYRRLTERDQTAFDRRTAVQYLATKVRQADAAGAVTVTSFDGAVPPEESGIRSASGDTLLLTENIEGTPYCTRIYYYDGYIREVFGECGVEMLPEDGEKILEARGLLFDWDFDGSSAGPLQIEFIAADGTEERLILTLRSGGEAMP